MFLYWKHIMTARKWERLLYQHSFLYFMVFMDTQQIIKCNPFLKLNFKIKNRLTHYKEMREKAFNFVVVSHLFNKRNRSKQSSKSRSTITTPHPPPWTWSTPSPSPEFWILRAKDSDCSSVMVPGSQRLFWVTHPHRRTHSLENTLGPAHQGFGV